MCKERIDWKELFGSDDEEIELQPIITFDKIPGLKLIRQGLDHSQQMDLMNALIQHEYFTQDRNQVMLFGKLPVDINWLTPWIRTNYPTLFEPEVLNREPLFDQAILNMYKKGEGILSHVDLLRFEDGILIVSLLSSCVMKMRPARADATSYTKQKGDDKDNNDVIDVLLRPGDILTLSKEARYSWEHGIEETMYDNVNGEVIERGTRLSITLRKLRKDSEALASTPMQITNRRNAEEQ